MDQQFPLQPFTENTFGDITFKIKVGKFPKKFPKIDHLFGNNPKKFRYIIVRRPKLYYETQKHLQEKEHQYQRLCKPSNWRTSVSGSSEYNFCDCEECRPVHNKHFGIYHSGFKSAQIHSVKLYKRRYGEDTPVVRYGSRGLQHPAR